ncbi:DUF3048 domain-containing protein [candidate division WWE3 bacterium]|nr:DUF3048 domain-containing protein [candidate division WWE3 bacterium]
MKQFASIFFGVLIAGLLVFGGFLYFKKGGSGFISPIAKNFGTQQKYSNDVFFQNPLTGEEFSFEAASPWKDIRPLAVMVNNYIDARPQSGLIYADLVYEIVAEGGIARLLPFFLSNVPEKIGPVRSTREYYLVLVKELGDAMLMHIGWSPQALEAIETWPVRSLGRGGGDFWRDNPRNVAIEHTAYTNGKELIKTGLELGWTGTRDIKAWIFKEDKKEYPTAKTASKVVIDFWYKGDYTAAFEYDAVSNSYLRFVGYDENDKLIAHKDQETNEQIKSKNVIVQFVPEVPIVGDDKNRLTYELIGAGKGYVFLDGKVIEVTWSKAARDDRTMFYDMDGNEMQFNKGKFWICVVPDRNIDQVVIN